MTREALNPEAVATAFERIADRIQTRTRCDRVAALQRACSEHPGAYERYLAAIQEGEGKVMKDGDRSPRRC